PISICRPDPRLPSPQPGARVVRLARFAGAEAYLRQLACCKQGRDLSSTSEFRLRKRKIVSAAVGRPVPRPLVHAANPGPRTPREDCPETVRALSLPQTELPPRHKQTAAAMAASGYCAHRWPRNELCPRRSIAAQSAAPSARNRP